MLIEFKDVVNILNEYKISRNGIIHIGACKCEEYESYVQENINPHDIIWIEALEEIAEISINKNIPNVFVACIDDTNTQKIFKITNNVQCSSLLNLDKCKYYHPDIVVTETRYIDTMTLEVFYNKHNLDETKYNFMNLDIQGTELSALKSAGDILTNIDAIYTEVNIEHIYENCALMDEIDEYLAKFNFKRVKTHMTDWKWGDALYVKINTLSN